MACERRHPSTIYTHVCMLFFSFALHFNVIYIYYIISVNIYTRYTHTYIYMISLLRHAHWNNDRTPTSPAPNAEPSPAATAIWRPPRGDRNSAPAAAPASIVSRMVG